MTKTIKVIQHYGTPRHSGRYPWGSGDDPLQAPESGLTKTISTLKKKGVSEVDIAKGLGISTTELRSRKSNDKAVRRQQQATTALKFKDLGLSNVAIGKRMGINESSVRALLNPVLQERANLTRSTADMLKRQVAEKKLIDVGAGVENHIGISRTKLDNSIALLKDEGYKLHYVKVKQLGTGKQTTLKVLSEPDVPYSEVFKNRANIKNIGAVDSADALKKTPRIGLEPIRSIGRDRILVKFAEDGGSSKDGVIELRRNVDDIALGNAKYAQVRVGVEGGHYMKGMAIYSDNIPRGKDIIYNTKKPRGTSDDDVFKSVKDDKDNPFGTIVRQKKFINKQGTEELSALNIVNEEGSWESWSRNISSQILSKQPTSLARQQLDLARKIKEDELNDIMKLTNPAVKKRLLKSFADDADSSAVHLKAAALPRQSSHVILPITSMKPSEIYAPNYRNGETVVLFRHPHGGTFEIPELRVNNKNPEANRIMKGAKDAVGIHPDTAKKLSGADFDGDTVIVIPTKQKAIKTSPSLKSLETFDPIEAYPHYPGMPRMTPRSKQLQMGDVSNLITDMTIKGADSGEIARAVKHSMVVIDAEKHYLDYKRSALDNGIPELKKKYQGSERAGASTLISRSSSEIRVPKRKDRFTVDPVTGEKRFIETGDEFVNRKGKTVKELTKTTRMAETKDARKLSSGTDIENVYADHANAMKQLANKARLEDLHTPGIVYSPSAKQTYSPEVASLRTKLGIANRNRPLERQAQLIANETVRLKKIEHPDMEESELKSLKGMALEDARNRVGAKKQKIQITDKEWDAIQVGAVSNNVLTQILDNTDLEAIKIRATPRTIRTMTPSKIERAKSMARSGFTASEIADALGVSTSTLQLSLK